MKQAGRLYVFQLRKRISSRTFWTAGFISKNVRGSLIKSTPKGYVLIWRVGFRSNGSGSIPRGKRDAGRLQSLRRWCHGRRALLLAGVGRESVPVHRLTNQEHGEQEEGMANSPRGKIEGKDNSKMSYVMIWRILGPCEVRR